MRKREDQIPSTIDFLLMDSDHSAAFAEWYLEKVLPRVRPGGVVCVDDVYHTADPGSFDGEGQVVVDWLQARSIPAFTCAKFKNASALNAINGWKIANGMGRRIRKGDVNPAIFFRMPD